MAMAVVHEQVHQRTGKKKQVRQVTHNASRMPPVFTQQPKPARRGEGDQSHRREASDPGVHAGSS